MELVVFVLSKSIEDKINRLFESEKEKLTTLLPVALIEHIGGTAVPEAITKGDLDINVRIEKKDFEKAVEKLKTTYQINQPENWTDTYASFKDDAKDLGIQVSVVGSQDDYFVTQRDYLKSHPEVVAKYNNLKRKFEGMSMDDYRKEKTAFFEKLNINIS